MRSCLALCMSETEDGGCAREAAGGEDDDLVFAVYVMKLVIPLEVRELNYCRGRKKRVHKSFPEQVTETIRGTENAQGTDYLVLAT